MGKAQVGKERVVQRLNVPDRHVARRSLGAQCACSWRDDRILCFPVVNSSDQEPIAHSKLRYQVCL